MPRTSSLSLTDCSEFDSAFDAEYLRVLAINRPLISSNNSRLTAMWAAARHERIANEMRSWSLSWLRSHGYKVEESEFGAIINACSQ